MTILRRIADVLAFRSRATALSQKIEEGVLSPAEREAAISALLLSPKVNSAEAARRMAAKTVAA